jgi:hypothetical protein
MSQKLEGDCNTADERAIPSYVYVCVCVCIQYIYTYICLYICVYNIYTYICLYICIYNSHKHTMHHRNNAVDSMGKRYDIDFCRKWKITSKYINIFILVRSQDE